MANPSLQYFEQFNFKGQLSSISDIRETRKTDFVQSLQGLYNNYQILGKSISHDIGSVSQRPGADAWTTNAVATYKVNGLHLFSNGTTETLYMSANDGKLYRATKGSTDWTVDGTTGIANTTTTPGSVAVDFSDAGTPIMLYKDIRDERQLYKASGGAVSAVTNVYGSVLATYNGRAYLSEFSTAGSGGRADQWRFSNLYDEATWTDSDYFNVGTKRLPITAGIEHKGYLYTFNASEMWRYDEYSNVKQADIGAVASYSAAIAGGNLYFSNRQGVWEYSGQKKPTLIMTENTDGIENTDNRLEGVGDYLVVTRPTASSARCYVYNTVSKAVIDVNYSDSDYYYIEPILSGSNVNDVIVGRYNKDAQAYLLTTAQSKDDFSGHNYIDGQVITFNIYGRNPRSFKKFDSLDVWFEPDDTNMANRGDTKITISYRVGGYATPITSNTPQNSTFTELAVLNSAKEYQDGFRNIPFPYNVPDGRCIQLKFELRSDDYDSANSLLNALQGYRVYWEEKEHRFKQAI